MALIMLGTAAGGKRVSTIFENDLCFACRVEPEHGGERFDRFLTAAAENLSRTRVKSLIEAGHASIDGATVTDASQLLRAGQTATVRMPPPVDPVPLGESIPLHIVFEDAHLLVIDKPAGLVVHPATGREFGHTGQCADRPLRRKPFRHRRRPAAGDRPSS